MGGGLNLGRGVDSGLGEGKGLVSKVLVYLRGFSSSRSCLRGNGHICLRGGRGGSRGSLLLNGKWQLVAAGNVLNDNVMLLDPRCEEGFAGAIDEGGNDGGVPSGVDDGDAEIRALIGRGMAML